MALSLSDFLAGFGTGLQLESSFSQMQERREGRAAQRITGDVMREATAPIPGFQAIQPPPGVGTGVPTAPSGSAAPALPIGPTGMGKSPELPGQIPAPVLGQTGMGGSPELPGQKAALPTGTGLVGSSPDETGQIVKALGDQQAARGFQPLSPFRAPKTRDWDTITKKAYAQVLEQTGRSDLAAQAASQVMEHMRGGFLNNLKNATLALDSQQYDVAADALTRAWTFYPNGLGSAVFVARDPDGNVGLYGVPMNEDGTEFDEDAKLFKIDQELVDKFLRNEAIPVEEAQHRRARSEKLEDAKLAALAKKVTAQDLTAEDRAKMEKTWSELIRNDTVFSIAKGVGIDTAENDEKLLVDIPRIKGVAYNKWVEALLQGTGQSAEEILAAVVSQWWKQGL